MTLDEIKKIHAAYWKPGYGSISATEAGYIQQGIMEARPSNFIEIGTASGMSTGFIASFMKQVGGRELITIDLDTTFWGDRAQPTGFLTEKICPDQHGLNIEFIRGKTSLDLEEILGSRRIDMAFIDAQHQHPWPTLDTIATLPYMRANTWLYHHDLALYKKQTPIAGIGPKYLFDQIQSDRREMIVEPDPNIYRIQVPDDYRSLEQVLIDGLYLPWTVRQHVDNTTLNRFCEIAERFWSGRLVDAIRATAAKFHK